MPSRFEQQQPSRTSGFFQSTPKPQHVGCRVPLNEDKQVEPAPEPSSERRSFKAAK